MNRLLSRAWPALADSESTVRRDVEPMRVWLWLTPVTILSLLSHLVPDTHGLYALAAATIGWLVGSALLWLGGATVFARRGNVPRRLWVSMCWWSTVGTVTYISADAVLRWTGTGGDVGTGLLRDAIRYGLGTGIRMVLLTILVSCVLGTRESLIALSIATAEQQAALQRTREYLVAMRAKYAAFVRDSIEPKLHALMADLTAMSEQVDAQVQEADLADRIRNFGAGNVRALSHLVADDAKNPWVEPEATAALEQVVEVRDAPLRGWLMEIPPPVAVIGLFVVLRFGYGSFETPDRTTVLGTIVLASVLFLILFVGRKWGRRASGRSDEVRQLVGASVLVGAAVAAVVVAVVGDGLGDELQTGRIVLVTHVITALVSVWLVNFAVLRYHDVKRDLQRVRLAADVHLMNHEVAAQRARHRLAAVLHGPIQGRLALASMTLRQALDDPRHAEPLFRGSMLSRVYSLLASVDAEIAQLSDSEPDALSFNEFITRLSREWIGIVDVEWMVADRAAAVMAAEPYTDESIVLIVEEAIMNARRHGGARLVYVSVVLRESPARELVVTVVDDGRGVGTQIERGLGGRLFDQRASSWSLTPTSHGGAAFTASIAIGTDAYGPTSAKALAFV